MSVAIVRNHLIHLLPPAYRGLFVADLRQTEVDVCQILFGNRKGEQSVYFPTGSVISMSYSSHGKAMNAQSFGCEGVLGRESFQSARRGRFTFICQVAGPVASMSSVAFRQHVRRSSDLRCIMGAYGQLLNLSLAQAVICKGLHTVAQRSALELLLTGDRVGALTYSLTHELLAKALGVRRAGISVAVKRLQRLGLIDYRFGVITIRDKAKLESESCECYGLSVTDQKDAFKEVIAARRSLRASRAPH